MKKIPSLFQRNYDGDHLVHNVVTPGAEWVTAFEEGVATIKYDGTCCAVIGGKPYKRYDAKMWKTPPPEFIPAQEEADLITGHWPGWLPLVPGSKEDQWHWDGLASSQSVYEGPLPDGTYELLGSKSQGNPYGFSGHLWILHGRDKIDAPRTYEKLKEFLSKNAIEGIVWWRDPNDPDCDKVKIKRKDFGLRWPVPLNH